MADSTAKGPGEDSPTHTQGPNEADPFQISTVVIPNRPDEEKRQLTELLNTHLLSRAKVEDIANTHTQMFQTVSERLLSSGIMQRPRRTATADDADRSQRSLWGSDSLDLVHALGVHQVPSQENEPTFLQSLLVWLVESCQFTDGVQRRLQYCDVLLRIAEECGSRGLGGLSALNLRYRRSLLEGEETLTADAGSINMMQWAVLLDAYARDAGDLYAIDGLLNHVADACEVVGMDTAALDRLADTMLADAGHQSKELQAPDEWISRAGDAVFAAGQMRLLSGSAGRRLLRLRAALDEAPRVAEMTRPRRHMRALIRELEERIISIDQTARLQHTYARKQHTDLSRVWRVNAASCFAGIPQAARAAAGMRDLNVAVDCQIGDFLIDREAAEVLADPIAALVWWSVSYGMGALPGNGARGSARFRAEMIKSEIHLEVIAGGHGLDMLRVRKELNVDEDHSLADRLLTLAADTTTSAGGAAALSASFARLHHGVLRLGGACELSANESGALHFKGHFPDWLTTTRGHLCPVGGGIVTVRESGIVRIAEVDADAIEQDGEKCYVTVDGSRHIMRSLSELLNLEPDSESDSDSASVALVPVAGTTYAVRTMGFSEALPLPLRALSDRLPKSPGVVGGTVLIGGEISPVLDLPTLLQAAI